MMVLLNYGLFILNFNATINYFKLRNITHKKYGGRARKDVVRRIGQLCGLFLFIAYTNITK